MCTDTWINYEEIVRDQIARPCRLRRVKARDDPRLRAAPADRAARHVADKRPRQVGDARGVHSLAGHAVNVPHLPHLRARQRLLAALYNALQTPVGLIVFSLSY